VCLQDCVEEPEEKEHDQQPVVPPLTHHTHHAEPMPQPDADTTPTAGVVESLESVVGVPRTAGKDKFFKGEEGPGSDLKVRCPQSSCTPSHFDSPHHCCRKISIGVGS
jgi:hypothetical protein